MVRPKLDNPTNSSERSQKHRSDPEKRRKENERRKELRKIVKDLSGDELAPIGQQMPLEIKDQEITRVARKSKV